MFIEVSLCLIVLIHNSTVVFQNPVIKSSERHYRVKRAGNDSHIVFVNATGGIYIQPFQSLGESHFLFTR